MHIWKRKYHCYGDFLFCIQTQDCCSPLGIFLYKYFWFWTSEFSSTTLQFFFPSNISFSHCSPQVCWIRFKCRVFCAGKRGSLWVHKFKKKKRKKKKLTWMWRPQKRTVPKSTAKTKWFGPVKQLQSSWPGLFFPSGESAKLLCVISKDFNISCVTHWLKRVILLHIITLLTVDSTFLIDYW